MCLRERVSELERERKLILHQQCLFLSSLTYPWFSITTVTNFSKPCDTPPLPAEGLSEQQPEETHFFRCTHHLIKTTNFTNEYSYKIPHLGPKAERNPTWRGGTYKGGGLTGQGRAVVCDVSEKPCYECSLGLRQGTECMQTAK